MLQGAKLQDILVFISILCWGIKLWLTRRRIIELTLVSCYPFLPGSDFIFYSLQDEETHVFCARFQTIVDLGAIKLLKKWNAEIKKRCEMLTCALVVHMLRYLVSWQDTFYWPQDLLIIQKHCPVSGGGILF